jgi:biopolymer transport protein ExbD
MLADGDFRMNEEDVSPERLSSRLREIFQSGIRRHLYVTADRNVPLKNVMDLVSGLSHDFESFAILTPSVERRLVSDRSLCLVPVPTPYKALGR